MDIETATLDAARREALLSLLDDPSPQVRQALASYFARLGAVAAPFLREIAHGRNRVLARHAAWHLGELKVSDPIGEFRGFVRSLNYELETGSLLLARTVSPQFDIARCCGALDAMAARCRELLVEPCSLRDKCRLVNRVLFHEWGFRGNAEHYSDPRNSLIDQVLIRRKGSPVVLGIIYLLVARRIDLDLHPIGMPGHFFVGCHGEGDPFYIDAFEQGVFRDTAGVLTLLRMKQIPAKVGDLAPLPIREVLCRNCRSLSSHYSAGGDTERAQLFASFVEEFEAAYARNAH